MTRLLPSGILAAAVLLLPGCPNKKGRLPRTPEEALAAATGAADTDGGPRNLYHLLDRDTVFSVISVHKDLQRICTLVRSHYPRELQAKETRRCDLAARSAIPEVWFIAYAHKHRLMGPLTRRRQAPARRRTVRADRVELESGGGPLAFCKEEEGWAFCGLRERFERLKVKTARDLMTVSENAESYRQRR